MPQMYDDFAREYVAGVPRGRL